MRYVCYPRTNVIFAFSWLAATYWADVCWIEAWNVSLCRCARTCRPRYVVILDHSATTFILRWVDVRANLVACRQKHGINHSLCFRAIEFRCINWHDRSRGEKKRKRIARWFGAVWPAVCTLFDRLSMSANLFGTTRFHRCDASISLTASNLRRFDTYLAKASSAKVILWRNPRRLRLPNIPPDFYLPSTSGYFVFNLFEWCLRKRAFNSVVYFVSFRCDAKYKAIGEWVCFFQRTRQMLSSLRTSYVDISM